MKTDLRNLTQQELIEFVVELGQPSFRGKQILPWLYRPGIKQFNEMTDLAKKFREVLKEHARISEFQNYITEVSEDKCVKFGFPLEDGRTIESVLIPEQDRNTLCISSQVGCAMNCSFCLTATMGFKRNLQPAEIVNQVCSVRDFLHSSQATGISNVDKVTNLVFMGMGEPLNNTDNILKAISILTEHKGLDMASRRITVSTCGIVPQLKRLGEKTSVNLAVSLHSVDNKVRNRLMPVNKRYPVEQLLEACRTFPIPRRKRIMFEYLMLDGINDSLQDARQLVKALHKIPCKINLIPYNECPQLPFRSSNRESILRFQDVLRKAHFSVFIRHSRGADISAACGQLSKKVDEKKENSTKIPERCT